MGIFDSFKPAKAGQKTKGEGGASLSIVHAEDGKRFSFSRGLDTKLGNPATVAVGYSDDSIIIGAEIPGYSDQYKVSKRNIYAAYLVEEVVKHFDLDYNGRTSRSFTDVKFQETDDGKTVAIIKIK